MVSHHHHFLANIIVIIILILLLLLIIIIIIFHLPSSSSPPHDHQGTVYGLFVQSSVSAVSLRLTALQQAFPSPKQFHEILLWDKVLSGNTITNQSY